MTDRYPEIQLAPSSTSYFSTPDARLDPGLFSGNRIKPTIRTAILALLYGFLEPHFSYPHLWTRVWLAGSGVSYQWSSARFPGDLDCLVGVNFEKFRECNPGYADVSDDEIAKTLNEGFNQSLMPQTSSWHGYELTFYVNPDSWDIRNIHPYAAYDLTTGEWTVPPSTHAAPNNPSWARMAGYDVKRAEDATRIYTQALADLRATQNPAYRLNAETRLNQAIDAGADLYEEIHGGRRVAFSRTGQGYDDWANYRWQAGKASGVVGAMKLLKDYRDQTRKSHEVQTYGLELPDADTMIRRAAERYLQK